MYCNTCGKEFQPWVDIYHYTDERGNTPILIYNYCDWNCDSDYNHSFCINCGNKVAKRTDQHLCLPCKDLLFGQITPAKRIIDNLDPITRNTNIYFFQIGNDGPIKVGISQNPSERLKQIQIANPYEVNALFSFKCNYPIESYIKEHFSETHLRGEWYKPSKKLVNLIQNLRIGKALNLDPRDLLI